MVLVGTITAMISNFIFYEFKIYDRLTDQTEGLQSSRQALYLIARDLRHIMASDSIFHASEDSLTFDVVDDLTVSYGFSNNQIFRNSDMLLKPAQVLEFTYYDSAGNELSIPITDRTRIRSISVSLTASPGGLQTNLQVRVQPRNF